MSAQTAFFLGIAAAAVLLAPFVGYLLISRSYWRCLADHYLDELVRLRADAVPDYAASWLNAQASAASQQAAQANASMQNGYHGGIGNGINSQGFLP